MDPRLQFSAGMTKARGNIYLLSVLFSKLIDNAIRYNKKNGIIRFFMNKKMELGIENSGPGINASQQKKIFDKFVRIQNMKHYAGGLGLGLPLSKAIIKYLKGTITIQSTKRGPTTVFITLPVSH